MSNLCIGEGGVMTQPQAIVLKILKAKYFPSGNFMEVNIGRNPSYSWRSMCIVRAILREGCRLKIGDGKSISLWMSHGFKMAKNSFLIQTWVNKYYKWRLVTWSIGKVVLEPSNSSSGVECVTYAVVVAN